MFFVSRKLPQGSNSNELPFSVRFDLIRPGLESLSDCMGFLVNINKGMAIDSLFNQETMFLLLPFTLSIRHSLSNRKHWHKKALALFTVFNSSLVVFVMSAPSATGNPPETNLSSLRFRHASSNPNF